MTKQEAIDYLNSIVPQPVNMVTLDAAKWAEFKTAVVAVLNDPASDPKYKMAIEGIKGIVDTTMGQ